MFLVIYCLVRWIWFADVNSCHGTFRRLWRKDLTPCDKTWKTNHRTRQNLKELNGIRKWMDRYRHIRIELLLEAPNASRTLKSPMQPHLRMWKVPLANEHHQHSTTLQLLNRKWVSTSSHFSQICPPFKIFSKRGRNFPVNERLASAVASSTFGLKRDLALYQTRSVRLSGCWKLQKQRSTKARTTMVASRSPSAIISLFAAWTLLLP